MKLAQDYISDKIIDLANLKDKITISDFQGLAETLAIDILNKYGRKSILKRETIKNFKCPNCNKTMRLVKQDQNFKGVGICDKWVCEDCSHILVLDWRNSEVEK